MVRPDFPLLTKEEIVRRLVRMTGPKFVKRPNDVTRYDVARWFDVEGRFIRWHSSGERPINDFWQVAYSQFFALVDAGLIEIRYVDGKKTLVRVAKPSKPPKKTLRPYIDFNKMTLGMDR